MMRFGFAEAALPTASERLDATAQCQRPRFWSDRLPHVDHDGDGGAVLGGLDDLEADHVGERHDEVGARSPADVLLAAEYPELLDDGPLLKSKG